VDMGADCQHEDGAHPGLSGTGLNLALVRAEARCVQTHERLTTPRRRVLELLLESNAPQKAYDLIAAFGVHGEPAKPPTVYRALEFLERLGFAHRIESLNAYVPCRIDGDGHKAASAAPWRASPHRRRPARRSSGTPLPARTRTARKGRWPGRCRYRR
jgi:Fur family zinc uptake transcriptional regulator